MDLQTESIKSLPLWVQLPDLDVKYWGMKRLSKICSLLGIPLKTNRYTKDKSMINYARVLIEFPMEGPFSEFITFFNERDTLIRQQVKYEWIPIKCSHCGMFGYEEPVCNKKGVVRQEWRRVPDKPTPQEHEQPATDVEGFTPVRRKGSARQQPLVVKPVSPQRTNLFQVLEEDTRECIQQAPTPAPNPY